VLCLNNDIDIDKDFRLKFLKEEFDINVQHACHYFWPNKTIQKIIAYILYGLYYKNGNIEKNSYARKIIKNILLSENASLLVFDWQKYYNIFLSMTVLDVATELGITKFTVPHGVNLSVRLSLINDTNMKAINPDWSRQRKPFDITVVQHQTSKTLHVESGVMENKIRVLGSARYCNEWRGIYKDIIPKSMNNKLYINNTATTLKIVFMDHLSQFRINGDIVYEAMTKISNCSDFELIIKPTTGANHKKEGGVSNLLLKDIAELDYTSHSNELIKWADVIIATTSSIIIEALLEKKIFIYPKHFHQNKMIWEAYEACWQVNDDDELLGALRTIKKESAKKYYNESDVVQFINDIVYGSKPNRNVLNEYVELIDEFSTITA